MDIFTILAIINALIGTVGNLTTEIVVLKQLAKQAGATDEQLDALDVRLTAALAARKAEQG